MQSTKNKSNSSKIKSFSVLGLFETKDVHIPFDEDIKILIGENGLGKTQLLNLLYYTLTRNFSKLSELPFNEIKLSIGSKSIHFSKNDINEYIQNLYGHPLIPEIIDLIGHYNFESLQKEVLYMSSRRSIDFMLDRPLYSQLRNIAPLEYIVEIIKIGSLKKGSKKREKEIGKNLLDHEKNIEDISSNYTILYFPTFRRIEEDLRNLGYDEERFLSSKDDNRLIHFGMSDVERRFHTIERKIDSLLKEGFTKISSEIISKLVKGFGNTDKEILDRITEADIDIILARVGNQITGSDKEKIREIVQNKEISDKDNSLFYFLQVLIDIYEKQKELDDSINKFKDVCNKYLIDKKVIYDESNIKIYIKSDDSEEPLLLNKLSSGEQQIISIFSNIYLSEEEKPFIVIFDEPELSLSLFWQRTLLPDIFNSGKCDFLLAATHSPFIFENELEKYAIGLNEFIHPIKSPLNV